MNGSASFCQGSSGCGPLVCHAYIPGHVRASCTWGSPGLELWGGTCPAWGRREDSAGGLGMPGFYGRWRLFAVRKDSRKSKLAYCVGQWNGLLSAPWLDAEGPVGPVAAMGTGLRTQPSRSREAPPGKKTSWLPGRAGSVGGVIFSSLGGWGWTCMTLLSGCITHPLSCLTLES